MIRTSRDYAAAIGIEPSWNRPPARFRAVRLMAEDLRLVGGYERQRSLADPAVTSPPRLVRTHVEGTMALAAGAAEMTRFLPAVTGGDWTAVARGPGRSGRQLRADGADDPLSLALWRRLAPRDDWQHFSGLRVRGLRLAPGGDGGLVMTLQLVGAERRVQAKAAIDPAPAATPPLRLAPAGGIALAAAGAGGTGDGLSGDGLSTDGLVVAGFAIEFHRAEARPHFALAATAPQMIPPGRLGAMVEIRLLANDAARRATVAAALTARFRFGTEVETGADAGAGMRELFFPRLAVTDRRESVAAGSGPALVQIRAEAETVSGLLMRAAEGIPA